MQDSKKSASKSSLNKALDKLTSSHKPEKKRFTIYLDEKDSEKIQKICKENDVSVNSLMAQMIHEDLNA